MTSTQLNKLVAKTAGWRNGDHYEYGFSGGDRLETGWRDPRGIFFRKLPDYLNSADECLGLLDGLKTVHTYIEKEETGEWRVSLLEIPEDGDLEGVDAMTGRSKSFCEAVCEAYLRLKEAIE